MSYEEQLIAEGKCPEIVLVHTEDGPTDGRCLQPIEEHVVTADPVIKFSVGIIGYSFICSCGRDGAGVHSTAVKAVEAGHNHIVPACEDHAAEIRRWRSMSELERAAWERHHDQENQ